MRNGYVILVGLFLLMVQLAIAAEYSSGVASNVLNQTTVTGNGQKITCPRTDKAEVTTMTVDLAPGSTSALTESRMS
ncbi:MAG: hypothetical protein EG822_02310 [Deltaproteobacteria bacterium]|nr:hypothetical protein [Deltaproteobacteria bacterium]TLN04284.1 MAG: hypothetical protein FDZ73_04210 [bacterium]